MNFFNALEILPNYFPLFCDHANNLNITTFNSKTGVIDHIGLKYGVLKFNFYSTYKYLITSYDSYIPSLSSALLTNKQTN